MLRYEYKYIIPIYKMDRIRSLLLPFMESDPFAERHDGEYTVRSIYFDTPDMQSYFDKIAGVKKRNKVRMRGYNEDGDHGTVFFEIKKKVHDPLFKNRASFEYAEAKKVLSGDALTEHVTPSQKVSARENIRRFMYHVHARQMHPVVTVIYDREPYQSILKDRENNLRITFDKDLRAVAYPSIDDLYDEEGARKVLQHYFIMEIKFNRYFPGWLRTMVHSLGLRKGPASKYAMCIETLGLHKVRQWN